MKTAAAWFIFLLHLLVLGCSGTQNILPASEIPHGRVKLTWDPAPGAVSYNLYWGSKPGLTKWNCVKLANVTSPLELADLTWGKSNFFGISVVKATGEGDILAETAYLVTQREGSVHLALLGAVAPAGRNSKQVLAVPAPVTLTWDEVPGALSYNLYVSESPGVSRQTGKKIPGVAIPYTLPEVKAGATYHVVVTAVGEQGESTESEELSFTAK